MPYVEREVREKLNNLSMAVYGIKSRWYTVMCKKNLSLEQTELLLIAMLRQLNEEFKTKTDKELK